MNLHYIVGLLISGFSGFILTLSFSNFVHSV